MAEVYVSPKEAIEGATPLWSYTGKVHDWRNHVPAGVRRLWSSFTKEQRAVLVDWADDLAGNEQWE